MTQLLRPLIATIQDIYGRIFQALHSLLLLRLTTTSSKFLSNDKYVISRKTAGAYFHQSGLASMDKETRSKIARLGGKAAHAMGRAHKWTPEEASKAGKLGVIARKASKSK